MTDRDNLPACLIIKSDIVFDDVFKIKEIQYIHEKYDGTTSGLIRKLSFERGDSVAALVYNKSTRSFLFTEQLRISTYEKGPSRLIEIVAGRLESSEDPKEGIIRELEEELGYKPLSIIEVDTFYVSPGGSSERIILFYIEVDETTKISSGGGLISENEDIKIIEISKDKIFETKFYDAKTIIGVSFFERKGNKYA